MTSEHFNKPTLPHHRSMDLLHRRVAVSYVYPLIRTLLTNSTTSGPLRMWPGVYLGPYNYKTAYPTPSATTTNQPHHTGKQLLLENTPTATREGFHPNLSPDRFVDGNSRSTHSAASAAQRPAFRYSKVNGEPINTPFNATGLGRVLSVGVNQILAALCGYITPAERSLREDTRNPRLFDQYLAKVQHGPNATFSKGWGTASAQDRALSAITDLTKSREFKALPVNRQLQVTLELMKYSIKYVDKNTAQIVKFPTIEMAEAFDNRIVTALTQSKLKVAPTPENSIKVQAIFNEAIQILNTTIEPTDDTRHPLMAARYVSGPVVADIAHQMLHPSAPPARTWLSPREKSTDPVREALKGLDRIQMREVLVRIVLDLIASNYEFDPKNRIELGIASLATRIDTETSSTYLRLSKFQAWANSKSKNTQESALISPNDVLRFLYTLDNHEAESRSITAKDIVQRVFPAIGDLASTVTYLVRRFPLIFNTDPKTGTSLDEPPITPPETMHDNGVSEIRKSSHPYSELAVEDIAVDMAPLTRSTRWSELGFQDFAIFEKFRNAVHGHSEEEYDVLTRPTYGLGADLLAAVQPLDRPTLTQFVNDILPTDTEPGQAPRSKSRAKLLIEHLFPGEVTPSDVDLVPSFRESPVPSLVDLDEIFLGQISDSPESKESDEGDSPLRVILRPVEGSLYHTGTAVPLVNVPLQLFLDTHAHALTELGFTSQDFIQSFGQTIVRFNSAKNEASLHSDFEIDRNLVESCTTKCTDPTIRTKYVLFIRSRVTQPTRAELLIERLLYDATFTSPVDRHGVVHVTDVASPASSELSASDGSSTGSLSSATVFTHPRRYDHFGEIDQVRGTGLLTNTAEFSQRVSISIDALTITFDRLPTAADGSCALHSLYAELTTLRELGHSKLAHANPAERRDQICDTINNRLGDDTAIPIRLLQEAAGTPTDDRGQLIAAIRDTFNTTRRTNDGSKDQPNGQFEVGEVKLMAKLSGDNVWILHPVTHGNVETMVLWKSRPDSDQVPPFVVVHTGGAHYERWNIPPQQGV